MIRSFACITFVLIALLAWPGQTRAAESYDNCTGFIDSLPAIISTQGTWCLRKDLSTAMTSGVAINIATNNVTLDCNDFKIGGLAAGTGTLAVGVNATGRFNATVRNCSIRGFQIGVRLFGLGGGHKVEGNSVEASRVMGIFVVGAGSVVRGNRVIETGIRSNVVNGTDAGIQVVSGVDVIDNLISGVRSQGFLGGEPAGINALGNIGGSIIGNRVSDLVPSSQKPNAVGIRVRGTANTPVVVSGNILKGIGAPVQTGILCQEAQPGSGVPDAISVDNVLVGFDTAIDGCSPGSNSVNSN